MARVKYTTRKQREALLSVYRRCPLRLATIQRSGALYPHISAERVTTLGAGITYRQFRRLAFMSYGALMVPWCGMWLGIEPDGYTHS